MITKRTQALDTALARIAAKGAAQAARKARVDADRRVIARRAAKAALAYPESAPALLEQLTAGVTAERFFWSRLVRARIELLDGFPHHARAAIREAYAARRQVLTVSGGVHFITVRPMAEAA